MPSILAGQCGGATARGDSCGMAASFAAATEHLGTIRDDLAARGAATRPEPQAAM